MIYPNSTAQAYVLNLKMINNDLAQMIHRANICEAAAPDSEESEFANLLNTSLHELRKNISNKIAELT